jgi:hypothetical protein
MSRLEIWPDYRLVHTRPQAGDTLSVLNNIISFLKFLGSHMAKFEVEDENPPLHVDPVDLEPLSDISFLSGGIFEQDLPSCCDIALADSEESLLRRIEAVEENVFSQMLEILRDEGTKFLDERHESPIIHSMDKEDLRALILEEFTKTVACRESQSSQRKPTGSMQESSKRLPIDVSLESGQPMRLAANGAAGHQDSLVPSQITTSQVSLEQAIAGLWPELQRSASAHPCGPRR